MHKILRFAPAVLLFIGAGVMAVKPVPVRMPPRQPLSLVPTRLADFPSRDQVIDSAEVKAAGTSAHLMRLYGDSSDVAFTVYVGYHEAQDENSGMHSPRNCLPGAGWEVLTSDTRQAGAHVVNRILLDYKGSRALVLYWYQGRGRVAADEFRVKLNLFADAAMTGRTEEALVRLVLPIASRDSTGRAPLGRTEAEAEALGLRVAQELIPTLEQLFPAAPSRQTQRVAVR